MQYETAAKRGKCAKIVMQIIIEWRNEKNMHEKK
jgi:hypothetical protein